MVSEISAATSWYRGWGYTLLVLLATTGLLWLHQRWGSPGLAPGWIASLSALGGVGYVLLLVGGQAQALRPHQLPAPVSLTPALVQAVKRAAQHQHLDLAGIVCSPAPPGADSARIVLTGWRTRQWRWYIVWNETFYAAYSEAEQHAVACHELGHALNRDALTKLPALWAFGVWGLTVVLVIPYHVPLALALWVPGLAVAGAYLLFIHALSRPSEYGADAWAAVLLDSPTAMQQVLDRTAAREARHASQPGARLADALCAGHPPATRRRQRLAQFWQQRVALAQREAKEHQS